MLRGGLTWRQVLLLRAYAKYLRQTGTTFSQDYVEDCLVANVGLARLLVQLFEVRFDPDRPEAARAGGAARQWASRSGRGWTRSPASTTTASCAPSSG